MPTERCSRNRSRARGLHGRPRPARAAPDLRGDRCVRCGGARAAGASACRDRPSRCRRDAVPRCKLRWRRRDGDAPPRSIRGMAGPALSRRRPHSPPRWAVRGSRKRQQSSAPAAPRPRCARARRPSHTCRAAGSGRLRVREGRHSIPLLQVPGDAVAGPTRTASLLTVGSGYTGGGRAAGGCPVIHGRNGESRGLRSGKRDRPALPHRPRQAVRGACEYPTRAGGCAGSRVGRPARIRRESIRWGNRPRARPLDPQAFAERSGAWPPLQRGTTSRRRPSESSSWARSVRQPSGERAACTREHEGLSIGHLRSTAHPVDSLLRSTLVAAAPPYRRTTIGPMTAVIGAAARWSYPQEMASPDDVPRLAAALRRPRAGYVKRLSTLQIGLTSKSGEAARQLGLFIDRIGDLSLDELGELYVETFERSDLSGTAPLVTRLARSPVSAEEARMALRELAPTLEQLNHERNPFVYVVRALCCLLLARVNNSRTQHS